MNSPCVSGIAAATTASSFLVVLVVGAAVVVVGAAVVVVGAAVVVVVVVGAAVVVVVVVVAAVIGAATASAIPPRKDRQFAEKLHQGFYASLTQIVAPKIYPCKANAMVSTKHTFTSLCYAFLYFRCEQQIETDPIWHKIGGQSYMENLKERTSTYTRNNLNAMRYHTK